MFSGIIETMGTVSELRQVGPGVRLVIQSPQIASQTSIGGSVAINGCCLTVAGVEGDRVRFDLMQETLRITNLGKLEIGDRVNFERAAKIGDEIGGHQMSGHILCKAEVTQVVLSENNRQLWFQLPMSFRRYLFPKGYIGIDGISLTIGEVTDEEFNVNLIPETLRRTNLGGLAPGSPVNLERAMQPQ